MTTIDPTQDVHWLTAYVLGVAFSVPSDAEACSQILEVTHDRRELVAVRNLLGADNCTDVGTRRRAAQLLNRAVRMTEASDGFRARA